MDKTCNLNILQTANDPNEKEVDSLNLNIEDLEYNTDIIAYGMLKLVILIEFDYVVLN